MSLLEGTVSLTRYHVTNKIPGLTDEFLTESIKRNTFIDIDHTADQESIGWVEVLNPLATDFDPASYRFGEIVALGMRIDRRKVAPKIVKRYLTLAEAELQQIPGRQLGPEERKALRDRVHLELMQRTPVSTKVIEVCWFMERDEVWLTSSGAKDREQFEELWRRTFETGLMMKVPFILAGQLLPADIPAGKLEHVKPAALFGGRKR